MKTRPGLIVPFVFGLALLVGRAPFEAPRAAARAPAVVCDWSSQHYDDFYAPPDLGALAPDRLGELLRVEHLRSYTPEEVAAAADLPSSPYGAEGYRVLFLSQSPPGVPQAVSGLVIVPAGTAPGDGFPILVHGHPTTGAADLCAPSRYAANLPELLPWVARGYLVTAPDYAGLGPPGPHPYGIGEVAGLSMLDSARAALRFCDAARGLEGPAANAIILEGHSQGGHSALFAHELSAAYAPELNVRGAVVFAPGAELRLMAERTAEKTWSPALAPLALAMYGYHEYYAVAGGLAAWLLPPYAAELPARAEAQCIAGLSAWIGQEPAAVLQPEMLAALLAGDWPALQPWTGYLDANTPGNYASEAPVLILQGGLDLLVPLEVSRRLADRLCQHGTPGMLRLYLGAGHLNIVNRALPDALDWADARLRGEPFENPCAAAPGRLFLPLIFR